MGLLWVEPMESQGSSEMEERGRIVSAGEGVRQKVPTVGRGMGGGGRSPPAAVWVGPTLLGRGENSFSLCLQEGHPVVTPESVSDF